MDCLTLIGLIGIATEILGAGFLVWCSYRTKSTMEKQKVTYDGIAPAIEELIKASALQFKDQVRGFVLISAGLIMQLISGFKG